ncbi:MAG: DUF1538 domain-containing protein [Lachnospiraceae bacterium]|nr:DUF1538 domain-containing protein [Lachnospiraceae bacterium]
MQDLRAVLRDNFSESLRSVVPIVAIIIVLCFSIAPMPNAVFLSFLVGGALLVTGMGLFNLGAQTAMVPIGERIGTYITKSRSLPLIVIVSFLIGVFITTSEPDLQVLAAQIPSVPNSVVVLSVALGVGLFLVVSLLRTLFRIAIVHVLIVCYVIVFVLSVFVPTQSLAIAFDAGGVTTGPMTVPFIMSLGIGVASIRNDRHATNDSFGLVGISSVGPILTVMILGFIFHPDADTAVQAALPAPGDSRGVWQQFTDVGSGFPHYVAEVGMALLPIVAFFLIFQLVGLHLESKPFIKMCIGLGYTFVGLVLFLTGVNVGFMPAGTVLGGLLAGLPYRWIIVPIAMLIGYFIVNAEPAVHVLNRQVAEITSGAIPERAMNMSLSVGMCLSLGLSMVRLLAHVPIMAFLLPGYAISLALAFFVPKIFTAIAFDSGGVASGPMTATFLLPFAMGVCNALDARSITDAFGVVAMVAMTPLITIQIMGLVYKIRLQKAKAPDKVPAPAPDIAAAATPPATAPAAVVYGLADGQVAAGGTAEPIEDSDIIE